MTPTEYFSRLSVEEWFLVISAIMEKGGISAINLSYEEIMATKTGSTNRLLVGVQNGAIQLERLTKEEADLVVSTGQANSTIRH